VLFNGPFPTFLKFLINSHTLVFEKMKDFPDPHIARNKWRRKKESERIKYLK
jgi:hypothetical protein